MEQRQLSQNYIKCCKRLQKQPKLNTMASSVVITSTKEQLSKFIANNNLPFSLVESLIDFTKKIFL